jgi:hypothetical protein
VLRRLLPLTLALALVPATASAAKTTCHSGHTLWSLGHARIFTKGGFKGAYGPFSKLYLCSPKVRHPRWINEDRDLADSRWDHWYASGRYVAYIDEWADAVVAGWAVQSVDLATGETRWREIADDTGISPGAPLAVAIDRDGSMAFLGDGYDQPVVGWVRNGVYAMHAPKVLATLAEPVEPSSLRFTDGVVAWTTKAGAAGSVRAR